MLFVVVVWLSLFGCRRLVIVVWSSLFGYRLMLLLLFGYLVAPSPRQARATLQAESIEAEAREVKARAEANAVIAKAEAEARAIELIGFAEAEAKETLMNALSYTPGAEWVRLMQEAASGTMDGVNLTITPEGLPALLAMLNSGSSVFAGMRDETIGAVKGMHAQLDSLGKPDDRLGRDA